MAVGITVVLILGTYQGAYAFLYALGKHPNFQIDLFTQLIAISLLAFLLLLLFSSSIASLGYLFTAKDIPLLLSLPVSAFRIYTARLIETIATSSWIFLIFFIPIIFATQAAFELPYHFFLVSFLVVIPFLILPAALGTIFITCFVNLVPPHRIRDILVTVAFLLMLAVLIFTNHEAPPLANESKSINDFVVYLNSMETPLPPWLPSTWTAQVLSSYLSPEVKLPWINIVKLFTCAFGLFAAGGIVFSALFHRGFSITSHSKRQPKVYSSGLSGLLGNTVFMFSQQLRGLATKELRMFIRDTTQSLQLLMLLLLTFVYLWNFRSLRVVPNFSEESMAWWKVILAVSNTAFGACVVSAIATRFVFPSVSLEGRAYHLLRCTPITIRQILNYKFFTWLWPMTGLATILLLSGAFAIDGTINTLWATVFVAMSMSVGIVGLAVGIGAVYSRFDWEAPTQVTASFGSLVFMLLALALIMTTLLPAALLYVLTTVTSLTAQMSVFDYRVAITCSTFLILFMNYAVAKKAISAGEQKLKETEC
jgi:ABC-2 type transport system permease protein